MTTDRFDLTVLIPCHNEEKAITATVAAMATALARAKIDYEILCVNNNSADGTEAVLKTLSLRNPAVRYVNTPALSGYGIAVRWGLEFYRGEAVVIVMADSSDAPEDVVAFYRKIEEGYDCAFGSRFSDGASTVKYPRFKLMLNRLGNRLCAWMTGTNYDDFTNGFKCYRRAVIEKIKPLYGEQFNLTVEMSTKAIWEGARFAVIPNSWCDRTEGVSKFDVLAQTGPYLLTLLYCWALMHLRGKSWMSFRAAVKGVDRTAPSEDRRSARTGMQ